MYSRVQEFDFDIALIRARAYGFFLKNFCKQMGKQAIHISGALRLLFGIKGARWEKQFLPEFGKLRFNEHWLYSAQNEGHAGTKKIENRCYW